MQLQVSQGRLSEIFKASQILLANIESLKELNEDDLETEEDNDSKDSFYESDNSPNENLEDDIDVTDEDDLEVEKMINNLSSTSISTNQKQRELSPEQKKQYIFYGSILAAIIVIFLAVAIPIGIYQIRQNRYQNIESMMMNVSYHSDVIAIGREIDRLPYDYRDIENIKTQYQMINREMNIIWNGNVRTDYERMRVAYYNLVLINNTTFNWDLTQYLDSVDNRVLLYDIYWSSGTFYFRFRPHPESTWNNWLSTNLPNDKRVGVDYYFTYNSDYTIFGYNNQDDDSDEFDAFKILSIKQDELRIYCYSNQQTYTLKP